MADVLPILKLEFTKYGNKEKKKRKKKKKTLLTFQSLTSFSVTSVGNLLYKLFALSLPPLEIFFTSSL